MVFFVLFLADLQFEISSESKPSSKSKLFKSKKVDKLIEEVKKEKSIKLTSESPDDRPLIKNNRSLGDQTISKNSKHLFESRGDQPNIHK